MIVSAWTRRFSLLGLFLFSSLIHSKSLEKRFGVGVANIGVSAIESLSLDWQATQATSLEFNLGFDTSATNRWLAETRASRNLFIEEQQQYFIFLGFGLLSDSTNNDSLGYIGEAGAGARFFFTELPNLGFSFRGGIHLESTSSTAFKSVVTFGIHYYF